VRKIMGLLGVYWRSIENFSKIAKPLYDLLHRDTSPPKISTASRNNHNKYGNHQLPSKSLIQWKPEHSSALEILVQRITSPLILAYPQYNDPFLVHTDASQIHSLYILTVSVLFSTRDKQAYWESSHMHPGHWPLQKKIIIFTLRN
jgi:hypothetical protein